MSETQPIISTHDVVDFFLDREGEAPYAGYTRAAADVHSGIDTITIAAFSGEEASVALPLRPPTDELDDPTKIYGPSDTSDLLKDLVYKATHARIIQDTRATENPYGKVLLHGWNEGQHVLFVETYAKDEGGDYARWEATTNTPEELLDVTPSSTLAPHEAHDMFEQGLNEIDLLIGGATRVHPKDA